MNVRPDASTLTGTRGCRTTRAQAPSFNLQALAADPSLHGALARLGYMDEAGAIDASRPDPLTLLGEAMSSHALEDMDAALQLGASLDTEYFNDVVHGEGGITAMALAVTTDSALGEVLLTPFLLSRGGRLDERDCEGRVLADFARFQPLLEFLVASGAPACSNPNLPRAPAGHFSGPFASLPGDYLHSPAKPIPQSDLARTVRPWLLASLNEVGCSVRLNVARHGIPAPMTFAAQFFPQQEISHALQARDVPAVRRLIELGALNGAGDFAHASNGLVLEGLTAAALAVLLDCDEARLELAPLVAMHPAAQTCDHLGRTLLHFATHPLVCAHLLDCGLDAHQSDFAGNTPFHVLPEECRALIARRELVEALLHTGPGRPRSPARL